LVTLGAPIDGKWTVEVQGRKGAQMQTLTLKTEGTKLTGSLDTGRGGATEITEGKIDGMNVSFKATRAGQNGNVTTAYTGKLTGEDLKLTATREGGGSGKGGSAQELDFKRAK
jgi:hypothetical protein